MSDTADTSQEGAFSRSTGLPPAMGKATEEVKCRIPYSVKTDFEQLAHGLGLTSSELLRNCILIRLYGVDEVAKMHAQRLALAAGLGHE